MSLYKRKGSPFFWVSFRVNGRRVYKSTGTANKKFAEKVHAKVMTEIQEGSKEGKD